MSIHPAERREERLRNLAHILNKDISDKELTMGQLLLEFYRQAALAQGYAQDDNISGAEGHKLVAEAIHDILKTLEAKRREAVDITPSGTKLKVDANA